MLRQHRHQQRQQLRAFLGTHPVHQLTGGENAYGLDEHLEAIRLTGLKLEKMLGPRDRVINAFPAVRTIEELERYPQIVLKRRFGRSELWQVWYPVSIHWSGEGSSVHSRDVCIRSWRRNLERAECNMPAFRWENAISLLTWII
jgi:hypothetical protein